MRTGNGGGGRDERFKSLYQKYYRRMVRFYTRAFRFSEEDGEDLAQEAFVRFYRGLEEYRGDAEWAYLEEIARNVAYNHVRAQKSKKRDMQPLRIDDPEVAKREPAAPQGPDYAERQESADRISRLREAIADLAAGQREALQLWLAGFKYDEIARALRISMDAVKSRLRDAKKLLRAKLGDDDTLPEDEQ